MLGAYLIHSKQWAKERKELSPDLSGLCVHELVVNSDKLEDTFCAKKQIDNTIDNAAEAGQVIATLNSTKLENTLDNTTNSKK